MSSIRNRPVKPTDKYAGMSGEELREELNRAVAAAKREGRFSVEELDGFVELVSPELDSEAVERLKALVDSLR